MSRRKASREERDYFRRVAEQNRALADEQPPRSLAKMFERRETMRCQLGPLCEPGVEGEDEAELEGHLRIYE